MMGRVGVMVGGKNGLIVGSHRREGAAPTPTPDRMHVEFCGSAALGAMGPGLGLSPCLKAHRREGAAPTFVFWHQHPRSFVKFCWIVSHLGTGRKAGLKLAR